MRVLFLGLGYHPDRIGGAYRYLTELATRLAVRKHDVTVIYPGPTATETEKEVRNRVNLWRYPDAKGSFYQNWQAENAAARALVTEWTEDGRKSLVCLAHAFLAPAQSNSKLPRLFLFTGPWADEFLFSRQVVRRGFVQKLRDFCIGSAMRRVERSAMRSARSILTISRYYQDRLPRWHGQGLPPISVIGGGVDLEKFRMPSHRNVAREDYGLKAKQFLFLCVRRLDPRMGLLDVVEAFSRIATDHPKANLWIAGAGPLATELQARIQSFNLGDRIRLLGFVPDPELPRLYGAADCSIMPSLDLEGFGLATVESLACGTPVIGSRAGATPELLAGLKPELLFNSGSVDAIAEKMRSVLDHQEWLPVRAQCRAYAEERFSWDQPVAAFEQHAGALLESLR